MKKKDQHTPMLINPRLDFHEVLVLLSLVVLGVEVDEVDDGLGGDERVCSCEFFLDNGDLERGPLLEGDVIRKLVHKVTC